MLTNNGQLRHIRLCSLTFAFSVAGSVRPTSLPGFPTLAEMEGEVGRPLPFPKTEQKRGPSLTQRTFRRPC